MVTGTYVTDRAVVDGPSRGSRAQQLQRGDTGVLKVAAAPQIVEGTMPELLRRYAQRFPRAQVRLREAIGWSDTVRMLERGEVHLGQNLLSAANMDQRFARYVLEPIDLLAACRQRLSLGSNGRVEIAQLARYPLLLLEDS